MNKREAENEYNKILKIIFKKYGRSETYCSQLTKIGRTLFGSKYSGTYSCDTIPKLTKNKPYALSNLDPSGSVGSHWVGLCKYKDGILVYDSFGRKSAIPCGLKSKKTYLTETDAEQKVEEEDCGQRCMAFLMFCEKFGPQNAKYI